MKNKLPISIVLCLLALLSLAFVQQSKPIQWEYQFVQMKLDFKKTAPALSELGAQGWEVVAINEESAVINVYLKRPKQ
jgi:hypothetical protein